MDLATVHTFIRSHADAAMITLRPDGSSCMARVEIALLDGRICSTGGPDLVRTRNLRRDQRCSLFVFGPHPLWVGLETTVTLHDGPEAPEMLLRFLRARHGDKAPSGQVLAHDDALGHDRPYTEAEYLQHIHETRGLVYEFTVLKAYGNV